MKLTRDQIVDWQKEPISKLLIEGLLKIQSQSLLDLLHHTAPTDPYIDRKVHELKGWDCLISDISSLEGLVHILSEVTEVGDSEDVFDFTEEQ